MNIDELIEKSKSMPNVSDGGSRAYSFGDYVLVCYQSENRFGIAREMEEKVMVAANNKNSKGVHTPRHVAMKRVDDGNINYCYVLQEKAKGSSLERFVSKTLAEQLSKQEEVLNIPQEHYDRLAVDLKELFNMGLEPKLKNVFYDENYGFTLIDLLGYDETECNLESLEDIDYMRRVMEAIPNQTTRLPVGDSYPEITKKAKENKSRIRAKIYLALRKIVPRKYHRMVLRTYDLECLDTFREIGVLNEDLTLTLDEQIAFNIYLNNIVNESFEKIRTGQCELWQIELNEIRRSLTTTGLYQSFKYYPNCQFKIENYRNEYDMDYDIQQYLIKVCLGNFYDLILNDTSDNINILRAKEEINNKKATR